MRQSHGGGEKVFVDYCGQTMTVYDRESGESQTAVLNVNYFGLFRAFGEAHN